MFELPEMVVLAGQINETLAGKKILRGSLGNSPHKFVWYNRNPVEFVILSRVSEMPLPRICCFAQVFTRGILWEN